MLFEPARTFTPVPAPITEIVFDMTVAAEYSRYSPE